ncbi:hypothetical protein FHU10_1413 [Serratia fonticola]|uniref:Uncharacterized protein n=1 Tax=Serratia fonticola TaxID=47917 RepID=A0A559T2Y4_SERFO|nr:hypothetical protein FHU09_1037 [Serratia fonticola]TQI99425.1 hypothetical protein FHU11_5015 [Serratia fonticola]TVZ68950.1 hypothetical protein FHU10_1413 [Serratia fonticola]
MCHEFVFFSNINALMFQRHTKLLKQVWCSSYVTEYPLT